jgi:threonine aldolase
VNFCSDNASGAAPEILRALEAANDGWAMPYGDDDLTRDRKSVV